MQLYQSAVMELLADNTLNRLLFQAYQMAKGIEGETEREGEKKERDKMPQTRLFLDLASSSAVKITNRHLFYM